MFGAFSASLKYSRNIRQEILGRKRDRVRKGRAERGKGGRRWLSLDVSVQLSVCRQRGQKRQSQEKEKEFERNKRRKDLFSKYIRNHIREIDENKSRALTNASSSGTTDLNQFTQAQDRGRLPQINFFNLNFQLACLVYLNAVFSTSQINMQQK